MRRWKLCLTAFSLSAISVAAVVACGGDDSSGGDTTDSGSSDATSRDASSDTGSDSGATDSGPPCTATPCVLQIAAGGAHTCALLEDHSVRCWGANADGELGLGFIDAGSGQIPPVAVPGITDAIAISAGGQLTDVVAITCALLSGGSVMCWGDPEYGLGTGSFDASSHGAPTPMRTLVTGAVSVASGVSHSCVVLNDGGVSCWGTDFFYEAGGYVDGGIAASPFNVALPGSTSLKQVSAGQEHTCAVTTDGHVWCWGLNELGGLGRDGTDGGAQDHVPALVASLSDVKQVAAGYLATCAVTNAGVVECWGYNGTDGLGRNAADAGDASVFSDSHPTPVTMPSGVTFSQVSPFYNGFCALATNGDVWCWGYNVYGQGGIGIPDAGGIAPNVLSTPTKVDGVNGATQISSTAAGAHVCARIQDGSVKCWGLNQLNQAGTTNPDGGFPVVVPPVTVAF